MRWFQLILAVVCMSFWTSPAGAQGWLSKKPKLSATHRVSELLGTLKTDPNERKRVEAAEALRDFDAQAFPEIVPILVDVMQNDIKPSVRSEAAQSLGKIRPVTQYAGQALDQTASRDHNWRVRWQARSSLMMYHMAGYSSKGGASKSESPIITNGPGGPTVGNMPVIIIEEPAAGTKSGPGLVITAPSNSAPTSPRPLPTFSTATPQTGAAPPPLIIEVPEESGPSLAPPR